MLKPLFVWQNRELLKIDPLEVMCISIEGNYTRIYLADKTKYMVRSTLSGALKKFPPGMFIKIHRSVVVSVNYINNIKKDELVIGDESLPIAKQYYKSLIDRLNIIT